MKSLLAALALLTSFQTAHATKIVGNGGDPLALEFLASAAQAISFVRQNPSAYPHLTDVDLEATLTECK